MNQILNTPASNFQALVQVALDTNRKQPVTDAYNALSIKERADLLIYANRETEEAFFRYLRNHVENLAR